MPDARTVFAQAPLVTDDAIYLLIQAPARAIMAAAGIVAEIGEPFATLVADKDEVTLIVAQDKWEFFGHRLPDSQIGGEYRLITFDQPLDPDLLGFMALVGRVLADAEISILAISAFARDHILVQAARFQIAWDALTTAQTQFAKKL